MGDLPAGHARLISTRGWAGEVRAQNSWTIQQWSQFTIRDRATMICDLKHREWLTGLEMESLREKNG